MKYECYWRMEQALIWWTVMVYNTLTQVSPMLSDKAYKKFIKKEIVVKITVEYKNNNEC